MKQLVFDMNEMSDSKEIYGQRPNPIIPIFIYTIVGLLVVGLIYCGIGKIEIVATSPGVIRPNEDIGTVSCLRSGVVKEVNYYNGQRVCAGDVLLVIDTTELQIQLESLNKAATDYDYQIEMIGKFLIGVEAGENPFSSDPRSDEYPYCIQFQDYLLKLKNTHNSLTNDAQRTEASIDNLTEQIETLNNQINGWESYKNSIEKGKNLSKAYPEYENMYLLYAATMESLKNNYELQKKQIEESIPENQKSDKFEEIKASYEAAKEQEYYQTIIQIDTTLQSLQTELSVAEASLLQYQIAKEAYENNLDENGELLSVSIAVVEQVSALLNQRSTIQAKLEDIEVQVSQVNEQIKQGLLTAQCDGIINSVQTLATGDIVPSGTTIATIIPQNENVYKVQLYVSNADIAYIEVGDTVKYNIAALPSSQYGMVNGTVSSISADTMLQDGQHSGYYLVECTIDSTAIMDQEGTRGPVSAGMQVEAKIITQEKTVLRYLLEKLDLF